MFNFKLSKDQIKEILNTIIVLTVVASGALACTQYATWAVFCIAMAIGCYIEARFLELETKIDTMMDTNTSKNIINNKRKK